MASEVAKLIELMSAQQAENRRLMELLVKGQTEAAAKPPAPTALPKFPGFDSTTELLQDYMNRYNTFVAANSIPEEKKANVFLTSQQPVLYKQISNMAAQLATPKEINEVTMTEIEEFLKEQYDPTRFLVRERYKFWSNMQRKPAETVHELANRIRQEATTCDFSAIGDPLDEAMRTRFVCSVNNEAVLKALFKVKEDELTFKRAIEIATETEDAAKVAKETVYGGQQRVGKVQLPTKPKKELRTASDNDQKAIITCYRCNKPSHKANECRHKASICNFCQKQGHLEVACRQKKARKEEKITPKQQLKTIRQIHMEQLQKTIQIEQELVLMELDTGACDNFITEEVWRSLGEPTLTATYTKYESASKHPIKVIGQCQLNTETANGDNVMLHYVISEVPNLNLLGRGAIKMLGISIDEMLNKQTTPKALRVTEEEVDLSLQQACQQLCLEFPDLFKDELGCLKDYELEVNFKPEAKPAFHKPRTVPFAIQDELNLAYEAGIEKGIWKPIQFNQYGTPVVPVRKAPLPNQQKRSIRVCGDYSQTVNPQLETHRQPIPLPEDLMNRLAGGYGYTKIDLADAYNQIPLGPISQRKLALSTHKGVLLQMRLPFGICSAPGYFQEIMEQLTSDLPGVAVYLDDILVSGTDAKNHLQNLRRLLTRLQEKGLRCRREKCSFAQPSVEYLGHHLSSRGISKGKKADAVKLMPAPTNVHSLRSFLGSVQFYSKFLPNLSTITEPLHHLTRKNVQWKWGAAQESSFIQLKQLLSDDTVLAHFNPEIPIGITCDASDTGIGVVLFHRYDDMSERPIINASKTLTETQKKYGQIQKEALAIVFALKKFHQFLYGRRFTIVTDHRALISMFAPDKGTPALAANRLARWALLLGQYDYNIEYRRTKQHGNADALSRLPAGPDVEFDREEDGEDVDTICTIKTIETQLRPTDQGVLSKESAKDIIVSTVMRYTTEGWPPKEEPTRFSKQISEYKKLESSLSVSHGCLLYGNRVVIPASLQPAVLKILHLGHFGIQRMKQLARTAVYWPGIDTDIMETSKLCTACAENQRLPSKYPIHPWMLPEKPWSRLHLDHAVNFMGSNWLVMIDAYTKYPCIHRTTSTSTKATTDLLEQDFAHFGYPHTIVTDNATTFKSEEFQQWCRERGITHLSGAPYHPATNGTAERMVQSFKQALKKSTLPANAALLEFLMHYRRTPLDTGYSPSQLLNGRQIRCKIDTMLPSPAHMAQGKQSKMTERNNDIVNKIHSYQVGDPCYALYCGPKRTGQPRWVPATVTKVYGQRSVNVRVWPRGPTWRRHVEQLQPRYGMEEDQEPGEVPTQEQEIVPDEPPVEETTLHRHRPNPRHPIGEDYGADRPRRSTRSTRNPAPRYK